MRPLPCSIRTNVTKLAWSLLLVTWCSVAPMTGTDMSVDAPPPDDDGAIPQPLRGEDLEALMTNPPFTRFLGVSDSLILTGIARMEQDVFATLLDTQTMQSHVVSKAANPQGWQLLGVGGDTADLKTLSAKIQVGGGQVITVRYQPPPSKTVRALSRSGGGSSGGGSSPLTSAQAEEARQAAVNYREGFTSDGYPKAPPPEMVEKLSHLSVSQREDINRQMIGLRNQGLGMEERRKIYEDAVNRATRGR